MRYYKSPIIKLINKPIIWNQTEKLFLSLQVPEDDLHYTVALTDVTGDGELASSSTQARLTVGHNDDPINLRDSALRASEGETLELVVTRGGHANGEPFGRMLWYKIEFHVCI